MVMLIKCCATELSNSLYIIHLMFTITLGGRHYSYPHFTDVVYYGHFSFFFYNFLFSSEVKNPLSL